ncbi:BON domain-containing protein [Paraburkholderia sp. 22B1P]|uniref:BON domain-containing protein n=1 Tax=Paraburkholderia sp. 22B1P TaxID=3080498 RepID=UPI00308B70CB|nr:BON domain-containing protein [Paraburkholderia sp. 22B1P]
MKLRLAVLLVATATSVTSVAFAQTPAIGTSGAAAKTQIRAEMKAEKTANRALAKKVQEALFKTKGLSDSDIAVFAKAKTGKVILAGMIVESDQEQIAEEAAAKVSGVQSVTSKLTVYENP